MVIKKPDILNVKKETKIDEEGKEVEVKWTKEQKKARNKAKKEWKKMKKERGVQVDLQKDKLDLAIKDARTRME